MVRPAARPSFIASSWLAFCNQAARKASKAEQTPAPAADAAAADDDPVARAIAAAKARKAAKAEPKTDSTTTGDAPDKDADDPVARAIAAAKARKAARDAGQDKKA